jgi:hypothetical protein
MEFDKSLWKQAFPDQDTFDKDREQRKKWIIRTLTEYTSRLRAQPRTLKAIKDKCPFLSQTIQAVLDDYGKVYKTRTDRLYELVHALYTEIGSGVSLTIYVSVDLQKKIGDKNRALESIEISAQTRFADPTEMQEKGYLAEYSLRFPYLPESETGIGKRSVYYVRTNESEETFTPGLLPSSANLQEEYFCRRFSLALADTLDMIKDFLQEER